VHPRPWRAHLPAGSDLQVEDLTARHSLPWAWAQAWGRDPGAPLLLDVAAASSPWCRAGELDEMTRTGAGELARLGLRKGDRLLWSTASSIPAVVVNIAALRAGLVVVPVNPSYTERELAHVVADVRPAAAVVDDRDRAESAYHALLPFAARPAGADTGVMSLWPVAQILGDLACYLRLPGTQAHYQDALAVADRAHVEPWRAAALSRLT